MFKYLQHVWGLVQVMGVRKKFSGEGGVAGAVIQFFITFNGKFIQCLGFLISGLNVKCTILSLWSPERLHLMLSWMPSCTSCVWKSVWSLGWVKSVSLDGSFMIMSGKMFLRNCSKSSVDILIIVAWYVSYFVDISTLPVCLFLYSWQMPSMDLVSIARECLCLEMSYLACIFLL